MNGILRERDIKWLKLDRVVTIRIRVEQREKTITPPPIILGCV
jgi:hypothetical protein